MRRRRTQRLEPRPRLQLLHLGFRGRRFARTLQGHARLDGADLILTFGARVGRHARVGSDDKIAGRNRGGDDEDLLIVRFRLLRAGLLLSDHDASLQRWPAPDREIGHGRVVLRRDRPEALDSLGVIGAVLDADENLGQSV